MSRLGLYLVRFALMALGFAAACLCAALFVSLLVAAAPQAGEVAGEFRVHEGAILVSAAVLTVLFGHSAFLPAFVPILAAEFLGRRDWLFHALSGAGVAGLLALIGWRGEAAETALLIAAGTVGGIAYWLVAGRSAGLWREEAAASIAPPPSGS